MDTILSILDSLPKPLAILLVNFVVLVLPGLIVGLLFKSVRRGAIVAACTLIAPVVATLVLIIGFEVIMEPGAEGSVGWGLVSLIGIPLGWLFGIVAPVTVFNLKDMKAKRQNTRVGTIAEPAQLRVTAPEKDRE
jgi:hypothetical protein